MNRATATSVIDIAEQKWHRSADQLGWAARQPLKQGHVRASTRLPGRSGRTLCT